MAEKYILRVTAGPGYDEATHVEVAVNRPQPLRIRSDGADVELNVRIHNYQGLPRGSPSTSSYFAAAPHAYNEDQYSIAFRFTPRRPPQCRRGSGGGGGGGGRPGGDGIRGSALQFGNDFDRPIRDRLPPGFGTAMSIVKWWIDPGLDGDAYADQPYLYGPALSYFNAIHVGAGAYDDARGGLWFDEGGDERGMQTRGSLGVPGDRKARMKWALRDDSKDKWVFEYGRTYGLDFFNPYLDFCNLALRLPGFQLPIVKYLDGQSFRYVLKNKDAGDVYLVVVFSLHLREDVDEDGKLKEARELPETAGAEAEASIDDVD